MTNTYAYYDSVDYLAESLEWTLNRAVELRMAHFMRELKEKKDFTVTVTFDGIPESAYYTAAEKIVEYCKETVKEDSSYDHKSIARYGFSVDTLHWWLESRGETKPAKHVEKLLKERNQVKLNSLIKTELGQILKPVKMSVTVRFSLGCEGSAKEYYHSSSCYWGTYAKSRDYVEYNHGGAVRFYTDNELIGRCWFVPFHGGLILFNTYGKGEFQHTHYQGNVVALAVHGLSTITHVDFDRDTDDNFYLNSNTCAYVGTTIDSYLDVHLREPKHTQYDHNGCCECCGDSVDEDDLYFIDCESISVCESCLNSNYSYVDSGDYEGYYPSEDVVEINYMVGRFHHYSYYHRDDSNIVKVDGDYYRIEDCVSDEYGDWHITDSDTYIMLDDGRIYPSDDDCIVSIEDTYYHIDDTVVDEYGTRYLTDSIDDYRTLENGKIYPANECIEIDGKYYLIAKGEANVENK